MRLRLLAIATAIAAVHTLAAAADPVIVKYSHVVADQTPKGQDLLNSMTS